MLHGSASALHSFKVCNEWVIAIPAGDTLIRGLIDRSGGCCYAIIYLQMAATEFTLRGDNVILRLIS